MASRSTTKETTVRLLVEAKGAGAITQLDNQLGLVRGSIQALNSDFASGNVSLNNYTKNMSGLVREEAKLVDMLKIADRQLNGYTKELNAANAQLSAMVGNVNQVDVALQKANNQLGGMVGNVSSQDVAFGKANAQLNALNLSTGTYTKAAPGAKKAGSTVGLGFLELSRAIEDAQYGIRGVLNNVPQMITLFNGSAGLAAAISITAVAAVSLGPKLVAAFKGADKAVKEVDRSVRGLQQRIEDLEKKPGKVALDYAVLDAAKATVDEIQRGLSAYEAIKNRKTSLQEERSSLLSEAVVEHAGGAQNLGNIIEGIAKEQGTFGVEDQATLARLKQLRGLIKTNEKEVSVAQTTGNAGALTRAMTELETNKTELAKLEDKFQKDGRATIDALLGAFVDGAEEARLKVKDLIEKNPEKFKAGRVEDIFAYEIGQASNENIQQRRKDEIDVQNQIRMARLNKDLAKIDTKEQKADKKLSDAELRKETRIAMDAIDAAHDFITKANRGVAIEERSRAKDDRSAKKLSKEQLAKIKKESDAILKSNGKDAQLQYEALFSQNALGLNEGDPTAVSLKQADQFLRQQLFSRFRQGGASKEGAKAAANAVADKGQADFQARMTGITSQGMDTQMALLNTTANLLNEVQTLQTRQNAFLQAARKQEQQSRAMRSRRRNNMQLGR